MRSAALTIAIAAGDPAIGAAQVKGVSWLDSPKPDSWNKAGLSIPAAPKLESGDVRCRDLARPPELAEDIRVKERGWDLVGAFQGGWQVLVIRGTAGYDGMCRPRQYQDFVFLRGTFAGTLSPQPMDSRTDGALTRVTLQSATRLTAEYHRYASTDALCCPSRTTSVVFDIAFDGPIVRPVSTLAQTPPVPPAQSSLEGTSWQLVEFKGGDDTTLTPDDRSKYTIAFAAGGRVSARVDCNRGSGAWKSNGPNQIALGPLALTRAACPAGSLHDQIVRQWGNIRSYVIRDGHLYLALIADGGIYEFERMK
jgi:heat shock protein HslJ